MIKHCRQSPAHISIWYNEVCRESCSISAYEGPTDELHPYIKRNETGPGFATILTALFSGKRHISEFSIVLQVKLAGPITRAGPHSEEKFCLPLSRWGQLKFIYHYREVVFCYCIVLPICCMQHRIVALPSQFYWAKNVCMFTFVCVCVSCGG